MTTYLVYMASPAILYFLVELITKKSVIKDMQTKKHYLFLVGICMTLMIGLRALTNGSGDTLYYYNLWEIFSSMGYDAFAKFSNVLDLEYGYKITTWVLSQIFPNGQWLLFLSGLFMSICVCSFVYKNCDNPVLAMTVFNCLGLFGFMVQGLRQAIAMCICLLALEPCKNRKFIKFILLVLLASLFHASAIVFLPVYFIRFKKFNIKTVGLFSILAGVVVLFFPTFFNIINTAINDNYLLGDGSDSGGVVAIMIYIVIIVFALLFYNKDDEDYPLFLCMAVIGMICMILRRSTNGIIERVSYFFAFSQMVLVSNSLNRSFNNGTNTKTAVCILIFVLCFGVAIYKASYSILIPYLFYWQL